jgi:hypothetical protein
MKEGDIVKSINYPGKRFTLVWYKKGDATCAIANKKIRMIVKTKDISLVT